MTPILSLLLTADARPAALRQNTSLPAADIAAGLEAAFSEVVAMAAALEEAAEVVAEVVAEDTAEEKHSTWRNIEYIRS